MENRTTWYLSALILLICILIAVAVYLFTGQVFLVIIFAPPVIHYFVNKKRRSSQR